MLLRREWGSSGRLQAAALPLPQGPEPFLSLSLPPRSPVSAGQRQGLPKAFFVSSCQNISHRGNCLSRGMEPISWEAACKSARPAGQAWTGAWTAPEEPSLPRKFQRERGEQAGVAVDRHPAASLERVDALIQAKVQWKHVSLKSQASRPVSQRRWEVKEQEAEAGGRQHFWMGNVSDAAERDGQLAERGGSSPGVCWFCPSLWHEGWCPLSVPSWVEQGRSLRINQVRVKPGPCHLPAE